MFLSKSEFLMFLKFSDPEDGYRKSSTISERYTAASGFS
jgi:hypothetical protein